MIILVTGVTGFVGYTLTNYLKNNGCDVIGVSRSAGKCVDFTADLTNIESVKEIRSKYDPDVIIHLAAMARTDECEKNPEESYKVNVISTKNLAETFSDKKFVFFSTYAVYNTPEGNCDELCDVKATNQYISTKIDAEKHVVPLSNYLIFRPSVIFGYMPETTRTNNYFMQLLNMVKTKTTMRSPADQYFNPILVDYVCEIILLSLKNDLRGIYNLGASDSVSKYEFNEMVLSKFGFDKKYLEKAVPSKNDVIRPSVGTISSAKIMADLSYNIPSVRDMISVLYDKISADPIIKELTDD